MKVGDLLYYRPDGRFGGSRISALGIALKLIGNPPGRVHMRTLWFDDWEYTEEPMPGDYDYNEDNVGVFSAGR